MNEQQSRWYSVGAPGDPALICPACSGSIGVGPIADHHPSRCPNCGIECAYLNWKGRIIMILPEAAPAQLSETIRWLQSHFDELDYVELLCALEELVDGINKECAVGQEPGASTPSRTTGRDFS